MIRISPMISATNQVATNANTRVAVTYRPCSVLSLSLPMTSV